MGRVITMDEGLTSEAKHAALNLYNTFSDGQYHKPNGDFKDCPFCGSDKIRVCNEHYTGMAKPVIFIECMECHARGGRSMNGDVNVAKKRWNRRHVNIETEV